MKTKMFLRELKKVFYIFLIPLFFIFHSYLESFPAIAFPEVLQVLAVHTLLAFAFFMILFLFIKSVGKTAIGFFFISVLFYLFGPLHDVLKDLFPDSLFSRYSFILPVLLILLISCIIFVKRSRLKFYRATKYLNILFCLLLLVDCVQIGIKIFREENRKRDFSNIHVQSGINNPDIYLIIADEYAGATELKQLYRFDNSKFEDSLKALGFYFIQNTNSNYNYTLYSMASMLSMNYLDSIDEVYKKKDIASCFSRINHNYFLSYLHKQGYDIENLSIFPLKDIPSVSENIFPFMGTNLITHQTLFSRLSRDLGYHLVTSLKIKYFAEKAKEYHYKELRNNMVITNQLLQVSQKNTVAPKFIYAHLMMPHEPYYFDKNGNEYTVYTKNTIELRIRYIEFLQYSNNKYLQLLNGILKKAKRNTIVVFMSDHGSRLFTEPSEIKYQFSTINAIYLPDKNYQRFYNGISNVNVLRALLNSVFDENLPLLQDKSFYLK